MPEKKFSFVDASVLAGQLYGRVLNRDADKAGYDYMVECLQSGENTIQQLIVGLVLSDEYIDRFVIGLGYEEAAKRLNAMLLGDFPDDLHARRETARHLARIGLKRYVDDIVDSEVYQRKTGPNRLPPSM